MNDRKYGQNSITEYLCENNSLGDMIKYAVFLFLGPFYFLMSSADTEANMICNSINMPYSHRLLFHMNYIMA